MPTVKGETGAYRTNDSSNPFSLTLPGSLLVGDPLLMCLVGVSTGLAFSPVPTGWTLVSTGNIDRVIRADPAMGGWQTADGTTLSVTVSATMNLSWAAVALDGALYLPEHDDAGYCHHSRVEYHDHDGAGGGIRCVGHAGVLSGEGV